MKKILFILDILLSSKTMLEDIFFYLSRNFLIPKKLSIINQYLKIFSSIFKHFINLQFSCKYIRVYSALSSLKDWSTYNFQGIECTFHTFAAFYTTKSTIKDIGCCGNMCLFHFKSTCLLHYSPLQLLLFCLTNKKPMKKEGFSAK